MILQCHINVKCVCVCVKGRAGEKERKRERKESPFESFFGTQAVIMWPGLRAD